MTVDPMSSVCNLGILDSLTEDSITEILESWNGFCFTTESLLKGNVNSLLGSELVSQVHTLCKHGLKSLVQEHFLGSIQEMFEKNGSSKFWQHFDAYSNVAAVGVDNDLVSM